jgi:hypothetical protein
MPANCVGIHHSSKFEQYPLLYLTDVKLILKLFKYLILLNKLYEIGPKLK